MTTTLFILSCWSIPTLLLALYAVKQYRIAVLSGSQLSLGSGGNPRTLSSSAGRAKMKGRQPLQAGHHKAQEGQAANSFPSSVPLSQARTILAGEVENTSVSLVGLSMQVRP